MLQCYVFFYFFYSLIYHITTMLFLTFTSSFPPIPLYPSPHSCPLFIFPFSPFLRPKFSLPFVSFPVFILPSIPTHLSLPPFLPPTKMYRTGGLVPFCRLAPVRCHRLSDTCLFTSSPVCPHLLPRPGVSHYSLPFVISLPRPGGICHLPPSLPTYPS